MDRDQGQYDHNNTKRNEAPTLALTIMAVYNLHAYCSAPSHLSFLTSTPKVSLGVLWSTKHGKRYTNLSQGAHLKYCGGMTCFVTCFVIVLTCFALSPFEIKNT